jgi:DNA repair protein RadC
MGRRVTVAYECGHSRKRAVEEAAVVAVTTTAVGAVVDDTAATVPPGPPPTVSQAQPFTQVVRDPAKYQATLARAKEIGPISDSTKLYALCREQMEKESREVFYVVCIDMNLNLVNFEELARGSKSRVGFEVEDIWQLIAITRPHGYAIAHCHPSGNPRPSKADRDFTAQIRSSSKKLFPNTAFLDHVIVGQRQYYSFADHRWE